MSYLEKFNYWKTSLFFDEQTRSELAQLDVSKDQKEIEDRFYKDLEFGTAGMRGIMGAGINRMNKYTVAKATAGFAQYLIKTHGLTACQTNGVVVARDTRNNSYEFSKITADVFSAMGIKVYFLKNPSPIPVMSFTIKSLEALGGVVITASHNPKEYNGYKAYDQTGCQLSPSVAKDVISFVEAVDDYTKINFEKNRKLIKKIDFTELFVDEILRQSRLKNKEIKQNLKIVYSPLHGSGFVPVTMALARDGFKNVYIVKEQKKPNGNFPTVSAPNPETADALNLGIELAKKVDADIVLGTDPDADRVGVAVKTNEGYKLLTGNQIGVLLLKFLIENLDWNNLKKPAIIKSIVTSELGAEIAKKNNISVFSTLTGFKFIGQKITEFKEAKIAGDETKSFDFLMGYEESYGYLVGTHARDKDSVVSSMLICQMSAVAKSQGKTLLDKLNDIYAEYGFYIDTQESFTLTGKDGLEKIESIMKKLRKDGSPFEEKVKVEDYLKDVLAEPGFGVHPKSNVLKYIFEDDSWICVRPSGTEPKIKIYYSIKGKTEKDANDRLNNLKTTLKEKMAV